MLPLGATNCEQIFTRAFDAIVAKTREFAGRDADRVNHDTINVRSEFVLHYLQKHYNLIQAISDVSSSRHSFASGDEHLLLNDPTLLAQLCQHLLANNALADRRFLITQRIRANADFLPLINWIRLPPDESWWPCDAIVRFIMGRSQSQPPYSATVVMRGTMPALEFDGVVVRNTGEFQSDERVMVEIDRLTRRWYEVLLGELKMQR